jgi:hypothetical protein
MVNLSDEAIEFFIGFVGQMLAEDDLEQETRQFLDKTYEELTDAYENGETND